MVGFRSQRTATRPRHVAMAPSPSYLPASCRDGEAHPSCDRLRGSLRSGDMSPLPTAHCQLKPTSSTLLHGHFYDGEGAVATGGSRLSRPLPSRRFRSSGSSTLPRRPAVAEDCDPPATRGDGALAIVSANRLPEISPFPRNARRRGRRRYGTIHYPTTNYQLNRKIVNSQLPTTIYISPLLHG